MKIKLLIISIAIALCLSAAPAMADFNSGPSVVDRVAGYYGGSGGEFSLSTATLSTSLYVGTTSGIGLTNYVGTGNVGDPPSQNMTTSFQTFCIESNELVGPFPHMIEETWVNTSGPTGSQAVAGGSGGPHPDPLDPRTAYLYTQFATGNLTGYDYNPLNTRATSAVDLQAAIYFIEQEVGGSNLGQSGTWITQATTAVNPGGVWSGKGIGLVRVLNLYDHSAILPRQDLLYLLPVPGAVLLGILGLTVAGIKLRKFA